MKKFLSMLLILIILIGVWWVYGKVSVSETYTTAVSVEYEESFEGKGVVIRNEYPVVSELSGTLQNNVVPGTRITKYTRLGYVYSGNADAKVIAELTEVNERIEELNKIQDSTYLKITDVSEIEAKITELTRQLAVKGREGNNRELQAITSEINLLVSRKCYLEGGDPGENNDMSALINRRDELESRLSGKREGLSAPASGLYYDFVDGYEGLKMSDVTTIDANTISKIKNGHSVGKETENAVCKVVDSSGWIVSVVADKDTVEGLIEGQAVKIRFTGSGEQPVDARIHSFVYDGKKIIVNIEGTRYVGDVYSQRVCTVEIIKNTYRGLKIPSKAIYDKGEEGRFVDVRKPSGNVPKKVTVLYTMSDGTAIVKAGTDAEELLLYDEVVVRTKRN